MLKLGVILIFVFSFPNLVELLVEWERFSNKITLYSLIPGMYSEVGHFYEYTLKLAEAAQINNWRHIALVTDTC